MRLLIALVVIACSIVLALNRDFSDGGGFGSGGRNVNGSVRLSDRPIYKCRVAPGHNRVAYIHRDGRVQIEGIDDDSRDEILAVPAQRASCVDFARSESSLIAGYYDGRILHWAEKNETWSSRAIIRHPHPVVCCDVSPNGSRLAFADSLGTVSIVAFGRPASSKPLVRKISGRVCCVRFTPDGRRLIVGAYDGTVWLLATDGENLPQILNGHRGAAGVVAADSDGRRLASGDSTGVLIVRDISNGRVLWRECVARVKVVSLAFSPDDRWIAVSTGHRRQVEIRDAKTGEVIHKIIRHRTAVSYVSFLNNETLLTAGHDGLIHTTDLSQLDRRGPKPDYSTGVVP